MIVQQSSELLAEVEKNGFAGPFYGCSTEEMDEFRERIERDALDTPSKIYGFPIGRDRHLDCRAIYELFTLPTIVSRLTQILGPDLLLWRSGFFPKPPGAPETAWHKAAVFTDFTKYPILELPNPNGLFQLTAWIAIDEANLENGCVQLIPGTQNVKMMTKRETVVEQSNDRQREFGPKNDGFFGYDVKYDIDSLDMSTVVNMQCKPGEFFIFDQRTLHGSPPNRTDRRRLGINFRVITPDVKTYGHFLPEGKIEHYGKVYDLTKWGCLVYSGEDRFGLNKIVEPPLD
jgi:non-haem Fe2+, alpha-ketoglutarate-dependent halogenase